MDVPSGHETNVMICESGRAWTEGCPQIFLSFREWRPTLSSMSNKAPNVRQFMSHVLFSLPDTATLEEAAQFFATHKLTTLPVVRADGVCGVLSDFLLLRLLLRARPEGGRNAKLGEFTDELDPVVTVEENESIVHALRMMIQSPNHRIYALNGGKLSGALSPKDLLLYMAGVKDAHALDESIHAQLETALRELQDMRRELSTYQRMFQDAPYLMHSVDMQGKIVNANRMVHFVLGYEDGELVGKSLRQLYPPENYKEALHGLETVKTIGFHPLVNVVMLKKTGEPIRIDVASTLKKDAEGRPEGTITVGRLSDSHRMVNYLQKAARLHAEPLSRKTD